MMRSWDDEKIEVEFDIAQNKPVSFRWQEKVHGIQDVLDTWVFEVPWDTEVINTRSFKVLTNTEKVFEICFDVNDDCWYLVASND